MIKYEICPRCKSKFGVKNGKRKMNKRGESKQYYKCQNCGKQFPVKRETLNRTEKRLFSLLYRLIKYEAKKGDTLKKIVAECNKEVNSIGKFSLEVTSDNIDINSLKNIKLIVCENNDNIDIIKTYPTKVKTPPENIDIIENCSIAGKQSSKKLAEILEHFLDKYD